MAKNFTMRVSEQKGASLESPLRASEQKDASLESPLGASEQKDTPLESPLRASEQKDASLESPFGVSEQKDASLESPLRASEQKDAPLESPFGVSEQKDAPLEHFFEAPEPKSLSLESPATVSLHQRPLKWFPTAAPSGHWPLKCFPMAAPSGHWPQKCFPTVALSGHWLLKCFPMLAPSGHWPPKWFPMAANEWKLPLSAVRVGAYCIRPQTIRTRNSSVWLEGALICNCPCRGIGWGVCNTPLPLETPLGHWPPKCFSMVAPSGQRPPRCFPTAANEWRSPLSAGRVGAYCIRPQMFGTRNGSVWPQGALVYNCPCRGIGWGVCNTPLLLRTPLGHPPLKCFPTAADEWRSPLSAVRVGAYCIRPQMFGTRNGSVCLRGAYKMVPNGSAFGSAAPVFFFRENCNKRRASASQWVETT